MRDISVFFPEKIKISNILCILCLKKKSAKIYIIIIIIIFFFLLESVCNENKYLVLLYVCLKNNLFERDLFISLLRQK